MIDAYINRYGILMLIGDRNDILMMVIPLMEHCCSSCLFFLNVTLLAWYAIIFSAVTDVQEVFAWGKAVISNM